ncbi:MAG: conjugal transfer protein, partial [Smithellaceae bacterium]
MNGYDIPIHRALTEQILIGGVPRAVAILNGTIAAAFGIALH